MNILITGAAGYLGNVLTEELLKDSSHNVVAYDNLMYGQDGLVRLAHYKNFDFVYGDVRDTDKLLKQVKKSDVIFPLAAIVGFPACDKDPCLAHEVNYKHIADIAKVLSTSQRLILPQTNSGYGIGNDEFCTEESPLNPISTYGKTKCMAEDFILSKSHGISLRLATVFGCSARMRLDLLVNDFTYKAVKYGYIVLFEKHFRRNYVHIRDVVGAFIFMMKNYEKCKGNIYNVGLSNANLTKEDLCNKIKEYVPNFSVQEDNIRFDPDKRDYIVSNAKIEAAGFKATRSIDDGVKELLKAYGVLANLRGVYGNI